MSAADRGELMTEHGRGYPFADHDLAHRLEHAEGAAGAAFVSARARVRPESMAEWTRLAGAWLLFDGAQSPVTQTFCLGLDEPADDRVLGEVEHFFHSRGAPVDHEVSPLVGCELPSLLCRRGYQPVELKNNLYRPIWPGVTLSASRNDRLRVRRIGLEECDLWAQISARGWGEVPGAGDFMQDLGQLARERTGGVCFLAELDGMPIAAAGLAMHRGVALMAGASTIPEARRQGAQLALLEARLQHAAAEGCTLAMQGALPGSTSQRNAERHGFRIAYTLTKWRLDLPGTGDGG